jgi:dephospho-CoA kinase
MIIGFIGKMGAGKDEAFKQLFQKIDIVQYTFAGPLKRFVKTAWNVSDEDMLAKPKYVRELLQIVGTNLFRQQVSENFWIDQLEKDILRTVDGMQRLASNDKHIGITDVRFLNEAQYITMQNGLLIRVVRPQGNTVAGAATVAQQAHASEMELEKIKEDVTIKNDGTKEQLSMHVLTAVNSFINWRKSEER